MQFVVICLANQAKDNKLTNYYFRRTAKHSLGPEHSASIWRPELVLASSSESLIRRLLLAKGHARRGIQSKGLLASVSISYSDIEQQQAGFKEARFPWGY